MIDEKKENCCGCSACAAICPVDCIEMKYDREGFIYPIVNIESCINCNRCKQVCPIKNNVQEVPFSQESYVIQHKDHTILKESTSGGAFTEIASLVIQKKGYVVGAAFVGKLRVEHVVIKEVSELSRLRNSKYVQSYVSPELLNCIKKDLNDGILICFSGTGCQIEALNTFLGKKYNNLILVDVICRAVPSPMLFQKYIEYQEQQAKSKVKNVRFRDKVFSYQFSTVAIEFADRRLKYHRGIESDPWLRAFFSNLCNRPSCYECVFKKRYRVSDLTIWDCFDLGKYSNVVNPKLGTSNLLIHSQIGKNVWEKIKVKYNYIQIDSEEQVTKIKEMTQSVNINELRKQFFEDALVYDGFKLFNKYYPIDAKSNMKYIGRILAQKSGLYTSFKKIYSKISTH